MKQWANITEFDKVEFIEDMTPEQQAVIKKEGAIGIVVNQNASGGFDADGDYDPYCEDYVANIYQRKGDRIYYGH